MTIYDNIKNNRIKTAALVFMFPPALLGFSWLIFYFLLKGLYNELYSYASGNSLISNLKFFHITFLQNLLEVPFETTLTNGFAEVFFWVIIFCVLMFTISYFFGDKLLLLFCGAGSSRIVRQDNAPVFSVVENMAKTAGLPVPYVYIINDDSPNIFTVGTNENNACLVMTQGLISKLDKAELEAVVSHEIAHILHGDLLLMNTVNTFIYGIVVIGKILPFSRLRFAGFFYTFAVSIILVGYGTFIAPLIKLSLSRRREFLADAQAALITRNPQALINALQKMSEEGTVIEAFEDDSLLSDLCILSARRSDNMDLFNRVFNWFDSHPDLEDRLAALRQMGGEQKTA